jgi:hypothetical protein
MLGVAVFRNRDLLRLLLASLLFGGCAAPVARDEDPAPAAPRTLLVAAPSVPEPAPLPPPSAPAGRVEWPEGVALTCPAGERYEVRLDPNLTPDWRTVVREGLTKWGAILGGAFAYDVIDAPAMRRSPCVISFYLFDLETFGGKLATTDAILNPEGKRTAFAMVWVDYRETRIEALRSLAIHELGHVLGLPHNLDPKSDSIMWPKIIVPGVIGCDDARDVCAVWGCVPTCPPVAP